MNETHEDHEFYSNAKTYWETIPPTVDGMLGGFTEISQVDCQESLKFVRPLLKHLAGRNSRGLDCGSGIGRVTKYSLSKLFDHVDMVEQCQTFLDNARSYVGPEVSSKLDNLICCGLQDFVPEPDHYDVIWCQWVLGHLTDSAFVDFFTRCKKGLKEDGIFFVKENIASTDSVDIDKVDSSFTRPRTLLISLFERAGLTIIKQKIQPRFPDGLYEVRMFALK